MAKKVENEKGFLVLEISRSEMIGKLGRYGSIGICDSCGMPANKGYYIAVLNQWFCEDCFKEWYERATRYKEDEFYEKEKFDFYCKLFRVEV